MEDSRLVLHSVHIVVLAVLTVASIVYTGYSYYLYMLFGRGVLILSFICVLTGFLSLRGILLLCTFSPLYLVEMPFRGILIFLLGVIAYRFSIILGVLYFLGFMVYLYLVYYYLMSIRQFFR